MMNTLSQKLGDMEARRPGNFSQFDLAAPLLVFSDYGGSHPGSRFQTYSFLLIQPSQLGKWNVLRDYVRKECHFEKGRMAYKKLNNGECARACFPWLLAADELEGLLITFSIQRSLGSIFDQAQMPTLRKARSDLGSTPNKTIERMFRVCHILSVVLAGLSSTKQEVVWITDEDDIAANGRLQGALKETLQNLIRAYMGEPLAVLHCATTAADNGSMQIEDLASIPDLIAGAVAEAHTQQVVNSHLPTGHGDVALPPTLPDKARQILTWTSMPEKALRRIVLSMYPTANPGEVYLNRIVYRNGPLGGSS